MSSSFLVIGAGSWGTALALLLANNGNTVQLWSHEPEHREAMRHDGENQKYLPGHAFPNNLSVVDDYLAAVAENAYILIAVPSHAFASIVHELKTTLPNDKGLVWATKGLDPASGEFLSEIAEETLGKRPLAILTGPSFAKEVAIGHPTAVVLATNDQHFGTELQQHFHSPAFRTYVSHDMIGAQLGGAVKNVLAIAVGVAAGLKFGTNTKALLITRGLAEMMKLGTALGAEIETLVGLSGLGDLVLTCSDNQSRNLRFGTALGEGKNKEDACKAIKQVVEGINTTQQIYQLAQKHDVDMPIVTEMYHLLYEGITPKEAVTALITRKVGKEFK